MPLLKAEPAGSVKTLDELFALAAAMEEEAAIRYAEIADRMRQEGNAALAEVFARLSEEERGHLASVEGWSQRARGQAPDPARIRWQRPETFDDEGMATADPRLLSAYRALSVAVRNEERAFAFWSYVAAHAASPEVRRAAEAMAHEELGHVALLRRERRRAFHAERDRAGSDARHEAGDLAGLERRLAALLAPLAARAPSPERERLEAFAQEATRNAEALERAPIAVGSAPVVPLPDDPTALAELLVDRYLEAGDTLRDEEALGRAQDLAGRAIARLAWLRSDLGSLHGA
ncbi:ferritin-like domain-containing protein [Microvirga thermotolerans]|uniref:Rubrerythrin family protein n=1 Tax=Microvirga thermotolerans TaxID=2651334 RepID=A0A5P9JTK4_9HYPH|nr:ferritin family protein [Microvirga thermotolerans]QFU14800.1 rubrerythrin family protein [Microvirga thermotolerans]